MRSNRLIVVAYASRGARLWVASRAVLAVVLLYSQVDPVRLTRTAAIEVILLSVAAGFVEIRARHERALLANLAIRPSLLAYLFAAPAFVGEAAMRVMGLSLP